MISDSQPSGREQRCGVCLHYQPTNVVGSGICYCAPPTPAVVPDHNGARIIGIRPPVRADELPCLYFDTGEESDE
jgi:hypothetical protein